MGWFSDGVSYVTVPVLWDVSVGDPSSVGDEVTEAVPWMLMILHVWSVDSSRCIVGECGVLSAGSDPDVDGWVRLAHNRTGARKAVS